MTMNLPYPFQSAREVKPDATGQIALIDEGGKVLAHLPIDAAYGVAPELSDYFGAGWGCGDGMGYGDGYGYGSICGYGHGNGHGYGQGHGGGLGDCAGAGFGGGNFDGSGEGQAKSP
jgi:hypothetical protein